MPNIRSAKKRMRIEEKRRLRNNMVKSTVRTYLTKARNAISTGPEAEMTEAAIREAISALDKAVSKGVLHRNNAARRKSRLMARLHTAQQSEQAPAAKTPAAKTPAAKTPAAKTPAAKTPTAKTPTAKK